MKISRVHIKNFRSIKDISIDLGDTTVFIGPNNAGKTAILDAIKIALSRGTGQRHTGFVESDVHLPNPDSNPRSQEPTSVELIIEEPKPESWSTEINAELGERITLLPDGQRRMIDFRVVYKWDEERATYRPLWQFLNSDGVTISEYRQNISFSGFFNFLPIFSLDPLRDVKTDFRASNSRWIRLLDDIQIPKNIEKEVLNSLSDLDKKIISADPQLANIAEIIGEATSVAIRNDIGAAKVYSMPQTVKEILSRVGIEMRNDKTHPWLPLLNQGQGLQSLSVIFLLKAVVQQRLNQSDEEDLEPIFAIEEPEAHLHPQAIRTLWTRLKSLPGQKLYTTHSPYFVQNVLLTDLKLVRLNKNKTEVYSVPDHVESILPWNEYVSTLSKKSGNGVFSRSADSKFVVSKQYFSSKLADDLKRCYRRSSEIETERLLIDKLQSKSRKLLSEEELKKFQSKGQRNLGEVLFAQKWVLVEGEMDYLLLQALSSALDYTLDDHGVSVINFQQSSGLGVYVSLAEALRIPWYIIIDSDSQKTHFIRELKNRGFFERDWKDRMYSLDDGLNLEGQLLADGNEFLLKSIMQSIGLSVHHDSDESNLLSLMENNKIDYMTALCKLVSVDKSIADSMPKAFTDVINKLRD